MNKTPGHLRKNFKPIDWVETKNECWECISHSLYRGYPRRSINGKLVLLNRFIWEQCFGDIPDGYYICHSCDNKRCINPEHLFVGTPQDNAIDYSQKNKRKLNIELVRYIRNLIGDGSHGGYSALASGLGVSRGTIWAAAKRKSYSWVQ